MTLRPSGTYIGLCLLIVIGSLAYFAHQSAKLPNVAEGVVEVPPIVSLSAQVPEQSTASQSMEVTETQLQEAREMNEKYAKDGLEFMYWPARNVPESEWPGLKIVVNGPCGASAEVRSFRTTPLDRRFVSDKTVEVDTTGKVLRQWDTPGGVVWSVLDNEVLLKYTASTNGFTGGNFLLAVATDGRYRVIPRGKIREAEMVPHDKEKGFQCPPYQGLGDSGFGVCSIVRESGHPPRYLIWEGICT